MSNFLLSSELLKEYPHLSPGPDDGLLSTCRCTRTGFLCHQIRNASILSQKNANGQKEIISITKADVPSCRACES